MCPETNESFHFANETVMPLPLTNWVGRNRNIKAKKAKLDWFIRKLYTHICIISNVDLHFFFFIYIYIYILGRIETSKHVMLLYFKWNANSASY